MILLIKLTLEVLNADVIISVLACPNNLNYRLLEKRSFNITKELGFLINTFEDFSLVAQLREEMEKLKPNLTTPLTH